MRLPKVIDPMELAFDIDGVVADTMEVFLDLARDRYGLDYLTKDHLYYYDLYRCLDIDREIIDDLICLTLDDVHTELVPPITGAPEVLTDISEHAPLRFITARIWPESIISWLYKTLPDVRQDRIEVVATGAPDAKLRVLKDFGVRYFVEDRLETCKLLMRDGIQPLLFDQPWNRDPMAAEFPRVETWSQLREWIMPLNGGRPGVELNELE